MTWTVEGLQEFEKSIAQDFESGLIAAPVHLAGGNEDELIKIFKDVGENDHIACAWRSHLHCLLKGVPQETLRKAIHDGRSIALCFPEYRVISSAIVGGIAPIAMGIAWAIKRAGGNEQVWCFLGDMTATSGIAGETISYATHHKLPITFIIEDNGMSVCTDTKLAWGCDPDRGLYPMPEPRLQHYKYELAFPHVGTGKFVRF